MDQQEKYKSLTPASIQILFNNDKLDIMKVLCLMNALSVKSKKQRKVDEILFYYSLVNFNFINLFGISLNKNELFPPSPNLYFRFQNKINQILLIMTNLKFIEINGDVSKKLEEAKVKLQQNGMEFWEQNKTEYFINLFNDYTFVYEKISFSSENNKKIKEGKYESPNFK
jgi:hypothetical protein